ncbi:STAS domain-containing protein [Saccharothrix sp. NRRL B-16348]|uniref:STAS domain-containing protein n=1 Tax=Saccharothrix sp. NRRL B-16348 TaxID=1415542 RepID=UPI0006AF3A86|nr:STAS domain-containing protein [Saccharothrix sp. NRRL B-16348]
MAEPMGQPSPILDIRVTRAGDVLVVGVTGELDMDTAPEVRAVIVSGLVERPSALVLDLTGVGFFSSAGLSLLLEARRRIDTLAVVANGRAVLRPIQLTSIAALLTVFPSVDEALTWISTTQSVHQADRRG